MMEIFGQQCVEITMEVLKDINRTDLRQRLTNLELKEMYSVDEHRPAQSEGAQIAAVKPILLKTLKDLSEDELYRFPWYLQFTYFQKSISYLFHGYPYRTASASRLVDQMVETCGPQSVEVTREVLMDMDRTDLVERLSETILRLKDKHPSKPPKEEVSVASLEEKLLETLEDLSHGELEKFKRGLQRISSQRLETAGRVEIVDLMVEIYANRSKGASRSLDLEGIGKITKDSSGWTKLEPEVNSTDEDEASTYSLKSEAGNFECSVSGLRWVCQDKVSFKYQFCSSEEPMKRMEMMKYMLAGPLIDITVISGKLFEVYLPHWICISCGTLSWRDSSIHHVEHSSDEMQGVASITTTKERLLKMLEDLGQEEFNKFKWFLQYSDVLSGLPRISCSRLENSNILDLVDLMSQTYSQKYLEVTKKIFQKINRNDLVQQLSDIGSESKETQWMNTDPESEQGDIFLVLNKLSFSECWMKMIITIAIF
ncbi:hypothetical protein JOQ06_025030 [Pogonophryne albipinna]|uniref:Pyrin domain-containing protein n=1 Tax=Pogonophryne albipinna TaxID=1090488 RepID=A0AAD6ATX4_9TELE|nr:hypothetical protein JOQ06_025030 [Pogonophryne albipinna]